MTPIAVPQISVNRASLDYGNAVRTTFSAPHSSKVVVLMRFQQTFRSRGQSYNSYQVRVTHAGLIVMDAIVDYPIIADPHAPLDLRRYDGATAFVLENALLTVGTSNAAPVAAYQAYTRSALQGALDAVTPAQPTLATAA
jgi:hypothetical protein